MDERRCLGRVMKFNDLLGASQIKSSEVLVLRHRPNEPELRKVLPWLAAERPAVFNAYQQTQGKRVEAAILRSKFVASFIGHEPGKALFVGFYKVGGHRPITRRQFWQVPAYKELRPLGMRGFAEEDHRRTVLWIELCLTNFYSNWKGKLVVQWPGLERSWWRWADRNEIPVLSISEESALAREMPDWDDISLTWAELQLLPSSWKTALAQWRGIYFILDEADGKGYVGSAYGAANILGRWKNYSAIGHGGNRRLRDRNPEQFRFCILQRVSPDLAPEEVIRLESKWKNRIRTRFPFGLNDN